MSSRRIAVSRIACCVVLGSLAAAVSYAQTAQSPSTPKGQTSKQGEECSAKTKALADLAQQPEYHAAAVSVEKIYQAATDDVAAHPDAQADPVTREMKEEIDRSAAVDKGLEALPDETLEMAADFLDAETRQVHACLSAALRNRRMDATEHMAQNLDKASNRHTDLLLVLSERHQKERDDEPVESPETLRQDLQGCQGWQKDLNEAASTLGTTTEQESDEKWWDGLDDEQHRKLIKFYITEESVGFWCGAVAVETGVSGRADARAYLAHASKYAALDRTHISRMYNDLLNNYNKALQWNHNALKALDDDQKLLAEDEKVIQLADHLLSRPPQPPLVFVQPAYAPPLPPPPQELHCVTQLNGSFAYTNCYEAPRRLSVRTVNHQATIGTYEVLLELGFQPEDTAHSRFSPGLSFDFGGFKLSAASVLTFTSGEVISFAGILATPNSLAEIDFEMPRRVKSREQCAAWIVWHLDQSSADGKFQPRREVNWVEEGRQNKKLLPWVMDMVAYHSRPLCSVQRDWWRLALKTLGEHLTALPDSAAVVFSFDGSVLTIRFDGKVVALPGEGLPWAVRFKANAGQLRQLPKRLMRECIYLSIWESRLTIDRRIYDGTIDVSGLAGRAEIE